MRTYKTREKSGQVTMEIGFAMAAAFCLVLGAAIIFSYVNSRMVIREEVYESGVSGRVVAANPTSGAEVIVNEERSLPMLDIFGTGN